MKKLSKLISIVLAIIMCLTLCPQAAFAADLTEAGGESTTPVVLNVAPANFSVTVPTGLPVEVLADGTVVEPDAVKIINNSAGAVKVANVTVEGQNDWTIVDFGTDPTTFKVDEKKVGLQINTAAEITADDGSFAFDATKWGVMTATDGQDGGDDECEFIYDAILAPQSVAITDATVANVIFTIGWHKAEAKMITFTVGSDNKQYSVAEGTTWGEWIDSLGGSIDVADAWGGTMTFSYELEGHDLCSGNGMYYLIGSSDEHGFTRGTEREDIIADGAYYYIFN